jgi:hypothetical protein
MQFVVDLILLSIYAFFTITIFALIRRYWLLYVNQKFTSKVQDDTIMLEIKLPREIDKSPLAMEMVLSNMTQGGGVGTWEARGIKGGLPATFSLEIASLEGVIHFYIRTHKKFKELLSASLYAHYPGVEVVEADDYTSLLPRYEHNKETASAWANGYKLSKKFDLVKEKEDEKLGFFAKYVFFDTPKEKSVDKGVKLPLDVFPMRTYIDLGLDKQKEEMKVDPLVSVLEFFGSLGKGEYAAVQFIVQDEDAHNGKKSYKIYHSEETHEEFTASDIAKKYKEELRGRVVHKVGEKVFDDYGNPVYAKTTKEDEKPAQQEYKKEKIDFAAENTLKYEEKAAIELIERKMGKPLLACVCRSIYVVKQGAKFNSNYIQNVISLFKPFAAPGFNNLAPSSFSNGYDYDWQNPNNLRSNWRTEELFDAFVEREGFHPHTGTINWFTDVDADRYFYKYPGYIRRTITLAGEALLDPFGHPHAEEVFVLNTEELATLFHLPGLVATVPTLPRIDSRKAVAPVNLPI